MLTNYETNISPIQDDGAGLQAENIDPWQTIE